LSGNRRVYGGGRTRAGTALTQTLACLPRRRSTILRTRGSARHAVTKARIVIVGHERLIVSYCPRDHAVYVLAPPGEDPGAVLGAARLVVPQDAYDDLADRLGVPSGWLPD
jgi:hypothetical protein